MKQGPVVALIVVKSAVITPASSVIVPFEASLNESKNVALENDETGVLSTPSRSFKKFAANVF